MLFRSGFKEAVVDTKLIQEFFTKYAIIRNFPGKGHERFRSIADLVLKYRGQPLQASDVADVVGEFSRLLHRSRNLISAASKTAWMVFQHPVIIFDSLSSEGLAREGLWSSKQSSMDPIKYREFCEAWSAYRANCKSYLDDIRSWLPTVGVDSLGDKDFPPSSNSILALVEKPWFLDRVIDMRLWLRGRENKLDQSFMAAYLLAANKS